MAQLYDMAQMSSSTAGAGPITLGSATVADGVTYLTFAQAGVPTGAVVSYRIRDGGAWEVGRGTYTSSGTTLTRGLLFSSTGSFLNLSGTGVSVSIVALGEDFGSPQSVSWLAGANPNQAVVLIAPRAMVITKITGIPMVANGATADINVKNSTNTAVNTTAFHAAGTALTVQDLGVTVPALAAGDYLYLSVSGTPTFALSVGNITVFVS